MKVEVLYAGDCPHAADALLLVRRCAERLGVPAMAVVAREGDYPSPTVLIDGRDVMGQPPASTRGCRLDLPTEERVLRTMAEALP